MKFDIKDDAAMALGALGAAACGAHALVAPKHYQDLYLEKKVPRSDHNIRWMGHATVLAAAVMAATIGEDRMTAKGRKDMFKVTGASWATVAGHQAYQLHQGNQKRDAMSGVQVALGTGIAALHLWKGFKKD